MGNKRNCIRIVQLFTSIEKDELLKTYEFVRAKDIAYFLNMKVSKIYNFCHKLTNHRGNLKYVNISQKIKCAIVYV
jgi:hypothetical protein